MSSPKSGFMCKHCSVCNCSSNTGVVVLVPAVPASIYKVSEDIIVNEGNNVTLTCFANGRPEPAISWRLLNPSGKDQPVGRDDQQSRSDWPVIAWTPEYFDCPMMFLSFCQKCIFKGRWRNTAHLLNVATRWLSAHICWDLWCKQMWAFSWARIQTCHCVVIGGDAHYNVSGWWQSHADGKLFYLYQLSWNASAL